CSPLPVLDWSKDQTRDGALDFRKKKISRENNPRDFAAMKQHLTNENGRIDWSKQDEIIVNLCLNCDRKWRKFRDSFAQDHPQSTSSEYSSMDHQLPEPYSSSSHHPPPSAVEPSNVHYHSNPYNRPKSEVPSDYHHNIDSPSPTSRKRRRRESAMSELQRLTSSNFVLHPSSRRLFDQEVHFQHNIFTADHALRLGMNIVEMARSQGPMVIDITLNGHQIFRFAMQGTGPDFDEWITRKRNVVDRYRHSSALVQSQIEFLGQRAGDRYPINDEQFAFYPGSFPIIIDRVGVVGAVTVAGSNLIADHDIIIAALEKLLTGVRPSNN
ncbi:hypothetical protein INT43_007333, partial [Umbelopsis isabellina]